MRTAFVAALCLLAACRAASATDFLFGIALDSVPTFDRLKQFRAETGLQPRLVVFYDSWPATVADYRSPDRALSAIAASGAIPVLTWQPFVAADGGDGLRTIPANEILGGRWDGYIDRYLQDASESAPVVWIRFAPGMNNDRHHWGAATRENFDLDSPFLYRRVFRHVVGRARELGLNNLRWVFCPDAMSSPAPEDGAGWNRASRYYPGNDYVDVLGMDGFNWGDSATAPGGREGWRSFAEIFGPLHKELRRLAPEKPLVVFETASVVEGGNKAAWIAGAVETARGWGLDGLVWFDVVEANNWRLTSGVGRADLMPLTPSRR